MSNKENNRKMEFNSNLITWTKEVTTCACCGREELKGTYRIDLPSGAQYFGSVCAKKQFGYDTKTLNIAKSKLNIEYNQVAYVNDSRVIEILLKIEQTPVIERNIINQLTLELISIRSEYKR